MLVYNQSKFSINLGGDHFSFTAVMVAANHAHQIEVLLLLSP